VTLCGVSLFSEQKTAEINVVPVATPLASNALTAITGDAATAAAAAARVLASKHRPSLCVCCGSSRQKLPGH